MTDNRKHILVRPETHGRLRIQAAKVGVSMQALADRVLTEYLDKRDKEQPA